MTSDNSVLWRNLSLLGTPVSGQFRVLQTGVHTPSGETLFGLDADGLYHVFVPVAENTSIKDDTRSAGVHLERRVLEDAGQQISYIDISCRKPHVRSVFIHLADDVLRELGQGLDAAAVSCRKVLSRWRELLDREPQRLLSAEGMLGLYGELWFLRLVTQHNVEAQKNWIGPLGAAHDFRSVSASLEVKTTQVPEGWRFKINGVAQLAPAGNTPLYLAASLIDANDPNGETVPQIIEELTGLGCDAVELFKKLGRLGYDARDTVSYREMRFKLQEMRMFVVDDLFPRIVAQSFKGDSVPSRVERIHYSIDLGGEPPIPMTQSEVNSVILALAEEF